MANTNNEAVQKASSEYAWLCDEPHFSDLTLRYSGRERKVHKVVFCPRSEWISRACLGGFVEAGSDTIELKGDDPEILEGMIEYMYKNTAFYPKAYIDKKTLFDVKLFGLAEKYLVPSLQDMLLRHLEGYEVSLGCICEIIREAYTNTSNPQRLKDVLVEAVLYNTWLLQPGGDSDLRQLMSEVPLFAVDLVKEASDTAKLNSNSKIYTCPTKGCKVEFAMALGPVSKSTFIKHRCESCGEWNIEKKAVWERYVVDKWSIGSAKGEVASDGDVEMQP